MRTVSLLIGRFEDLVAAGLRALVSDDPAIRILAADVAAPDVDALLAEHEPNVAVLNFGSLGAPAEVRDLHRRHPNTNLVVIANHPSAVEAQQLLAFGAMACLGKDCQGRDVVNAIHLASRGLRLAPRAHDSHGADIPPELFTPREADVLSLLQAGHSNAQIADILGIGVETVRSHAKAIYRKLGVSSRRDLRLAPLRRNGF